MSNQEKPMNKQQMVEKMAASADMSKADAERALNAFVETVTDALTAHGAVTLVGFGTFCVAERSARTGRNPQTGAEMQIPASIAPKFKAGKSLKDRVNERS